MLYWRSPKISPKTTSHLESTSPHTPTAPTTNRPNRVRGAVYFKQHTLNTLKNMASPSYLLFLVVGTVTTGCLNSIFTKYQDNQCVRNCDNPDVSTHQTFQQPALQTLQMFFGEMLCFFIYRLLKRSWGSNGYKPIGEPSEPANLPLSQSLKLSTPAVCDLVGTTLLHFGLIYIPVSVYQMLRGSLVLFVAFLSVIFLKRKVTTLEWISLFIITIGISMVGLSGSSSSENDSSSSSSGLVALGLSLVVIAEMCQAFQFVIEEHILKQQPIVPLQLVYYEGFYGAIVLFVVLSVLYFIVGGMSDGDDFKSLPFNMPEGISQMVNSGLVLLGGLLIMISIGSFNFFGISLTFHLSATARSTIDACRTLMVWLLAMAMGWESFVLLQFIGFCLLVFGTLCFNGVLTPENWNWIPNSLKTPGIDPIDEPTDRL